VHPCQAAFVTAKREYGIHLQEHEGFFAQGEGKAVNSFWIASFVNMSAFVE